MFSNRYTYFSSLKHATDFDDEKDDDESGGEVFEKDFGLFFEELKREIKQSNSPMGMISESEARNFYSSLKAERGVETSVDSNHADTPAVEKGTAASSMSSSIPLGRTVRTIEFDPTITQEDAQPEDEDQKRDIGAVAESVDLATEELKKLGLSPKDMEQPNESDTMTDTAAGKERMDNDLEELRELLPMFPDERLRAILKVFYRELGTPSIIELSIAVRETMPDYVTNTWLKKMSNLTANFVIADAEEKDLVSKEFLNKNLELKVSTGFLDEAGKCSVVATSSIRVMILISCLCSPVS